MKAEISTFRNSEMKWHHGRQRLFECSSMFIQSCWQFLLFSTRQVGIIFTDCTDNQLDLIIHQLQEKSMFPDISMYKK